MTKYGFLDSQKKSRNRNWPSQRPIELGIMRKRKLVAVPAESRVAQTAVVKDETTTKDAEQMTDTESQSGTGIPKETQDANGTSDGPRELAENTRESAIAAKKRKTPKRSRNHKQQLQAHLLILLNILFPLNV